MTTHRRKCKLVETIALIAMMNGLSVAAFAGLARGQGVPTLNIVPSCKAAAAGYIGLNQEFESCRRSEESAREILVKQWSTFLPSDRASCHRLTTTGTPGTYTELLTCLEMRRDARALPAAEDMKKETDRPPRRPRPKAVRDPEPSGTAR